jgi:hypothetical protein
MEQPRQEGLGYMMEEMLEKNLVGHKNILCILCRHRHGNRHKAWCC